MLNAHRTFFHQGSDYFKDTDPSLKAVSFHVSFNSQRFHFAPWKLSNSCLLVQLSEMRGTLSRDTDLATFLSNCQPLVATTPDYMNGSTVPPETLMQGYLFRRGTAKTFKTWKRRW